MRTIHEIYFKDSDYSEELNVSSTFNRTDVVLNDSFNINLLKKIVLQFPDKIVKSDIAYDYTFDRYEFGQKSALDKLKNGGILTEDEYAGYASFYTNEQNQSAMSLLYAEGGDKTLPTSALVTLSDEFETVLPEALDNYLRTIKPVPNKNEAELTSFFKQVEEGYIEFVCSVKTSIDFSSCQNVTIRTLYEDISGNVWDNEVSASLLSMKSYDGSDTVGYVGNLHIIDKNMEDTGENFAITFNHTDENNISILFFTTDKSYEIVDENMFSVIFDYAQNSHRFVYDETEKAVIEHNDQLYVVGLTSDSEYIINNIFKQLSSILININGEIFEANKIKRIGSELFIGNPHLMLEPEEDTGEDFCFKYYVDSTTIFSRLSECMFVTTRDIGTTVSQLTYTFNIGKKQTVNTYINVSGVTQSNFQLIRSALLDNPDKLVHIDDISYDGVTDMTDGFRDCYNLMSLSSLPTGVADISNCFSGTSVEEIPEIPNTVFNVDSAFNDCINLTTVMWNVGPLRDASSLFRNCNNLKLIKVNGNSPDTLIEYLNNGKAKYGNEFFPQDKNPVDIVVSGYYEGIKIPLQKLKSTLDSWPENTIDTPYVIDITNITDEDTIANFEEEYPSARLGNILFESTCVFNEQDNDISVKKYVYIKESASSVSSNFLAGAFAAENALPILSLIGVDISRCSTVESIPTAFPNLINLKEVKLPRIKNRGFVFYDQPVGSLYYSFSGCENLEVVTGFFDDDIVDMDGTFSECSKLKEYPELPKNLKTLIQTFARSGIKRTPYIPDSVTGMNECFLDSDVENITNIPLSIEDLSYAFNNTKIKTVPQIPDSVINMDYAFESCHELESVKNIPKSVESLRYTFHDCKLLTTVPEIKTDSPVDMTGTFSGCESLDNIGDISNAGDLTQTFERCGSLESVKISGTATELIQTFVSSKVKSVVSLPEGIQVLSGTFSNCAHLTYISELPSSITTVLRGTFAGCSNLKEIGYWDAKELNNVQNDAFTGLSNLESLTVQNYVQYLVLSGALFGIVQKPSEVVRYLTDYIPAYALNSFMDQIKFLNDPENPFELKISNVTKESLEGHYKSGYNEKSIQYALLNHPNIYVKLTFSEDLCDETITSIKFAFSDCKNLVGVNILNTVEDASAAFYGCINLKVAPAIPESVKFIANMFENCSSITEGTLIPDDTDGSLNCVYKGCSSLVSIPNIPGNTVSLREAFSGCSSLKVIHNFDIPYSIFSEMDSYNTENMLEGCDLLESIEISVQNVNASDKQWNMVVLKNDQDNVAAEIYNSNGELVKTKTINSNIEDLSVSGKIDELIISEQDIFSEPLIEKFFKYRRQFSTKNCLDPAKANFVFWAKDPNAVHSNILGGGGGGSALVPSITQEEYDNLSEAEKTNGQIREIVDAPEEEPFIHVLYEQAPIGSFFPFGGENPPSGFLMCNGQEVSRSVFAELFAVIGTKYGAGNGSTTFNVPDMRESVPVGIGQSSRADIKQHDVYELGEFKDDQLQGHSHFITGNQKNLSIHDVAGTIFDANTSSSYTNARPKISTEGTEDGRIGTTTHGKQIGANYIIKALKTTGELAPDIEVDDTKTTTANVLSAQETQRRIDVLDNRSIFSDEEVMIGHLVINGVKKPLYRRCFFEPSPNTWGNGQKLTTIINFERLMRNDMFVCYSGSGYMTNAQASNLRGIAQIKPDGDVVLVIENMNRSYPINVILEYTKTTN